MMTLETLLDAGNSYTEIASALSMTKANVAKHAAQIKMRRGEVLGHLDPALVRKRYVDEAMPVDALALECEISVPQLKRYLIAHGIQRDAGTMYRAGVRVQARKGVRVPRSQRDPASRARRGSSEHRQKLAAAKAGKTGERANRWKGGHEIGGYAGAGGGARKTYEHRVIAARILGRVLLPTEHVHHIDKNRKNNEPCNLLVLGSSGHSLLHVAMRRDLDLDQRQWLRDNNIPFEDLQSHA
jgi:hypothetical protein